MITPWNSSEAQSNKNKKYISITKWKTKSSLLMGIKKLSAF